MPGSDRDAPGANRLDERIEVPSTGFRRRGPAEAGAQALTGISGQGELRHGEQRAAGVQQRAIHPPPVIRKDAIREHTLGEALGLSGTVMLLDGNQGTDPRPYLAQGRACYDDAGFGHALNQSNHGAMIPTRFAPAPGVTDNLGMNRAAAVGRLAQALGWLPLPVNHALGWMLGMLLWLFPNRQRHMAKANLDIAFPALSAARRRRLVRETLRELGKCVTELGVLWYAGESRLRRLIRSRVGEDVWREICAADRPVLVAAPHLGSFEMLNLYCARHLRLRILYRLPRQAALEDMMVARRERFGTEMIRADRSGLVKLLRAVSDQDVIAILPDQVPKKGQGVTAPFFAKGAPTMSLFGRLARRLEPMLVVAFAERLSWGRGYRLHFQHLDDGVAGDDPVAAAGVLNAAIEQCARQFPAQYQWTYNRYQLKRS